MRSRWILSAFLALAATSNAHAAIQCRLAYTPAAKQNPVFSVARPLLPQAGRAGFAFPADGIIRTATVLFQADRGNPATGTLQLSIDVATNLANPSLNAQYSAEFAGYNIQRGDRVAKQVIMPGGHALERQDFKPTQQALQLSFIGPGGFPAPAIALLKGQQVSRIELSCQNE